MRKQESTHEAALDACASREKTPLRIPKHSQRFAVNFLINPSSAKYLQGRFLQIIPLPTI